MIVSEFSRLYAFGRGAVTAPLLAVERMISFNTVNSRHFEGG